jgi:hypothetical protein
MQTLTWDGEALGEAVVREPGFLTTSAHGGGSVVDHRRRFFLRFAEERGPLTAEDLAEFHRSREPEPGAYAVCMERPDAQTWSLSHIVVTECEVSLAYADGPPHRTPFGAPVTLRRRG